MLSSSFDIDDDNLIIVKAIAVGIDGLLGMSYLADFNFEVRPDERQIRVESVATQADD